MSHQHELVLKQWLEKTEWVQETAQGGELGMHRADVLKKRIETLTEVNAELLSALKDLLAETGGLDRAARAAINKAERK
jgi:hypothetical protein